MKQWRVSFGRIDLDTGANPKYVDKQEDFLRQALTTSRTELIQEMRERVEAKKMRIAGTVISREFREANNDTLVEVLTILDELEGK